MSKAHRLPLPTCTMDWYVSDNYHWQKLFPFCFEVHNRFPYILVCAIIFAMFWLLWSWGLTHLCDWRSILAVLRDHGMPVNKLGLLMVLSLLDCLSNPLLQSSLHFLWTIMMATDCLYWESEGIKQGWDLDKPKQIAVWVDDEFLL